MRVMPCPNCSTTKGVWISRIMVGRKPPGMWYYLECKKCHWCSATRLFKWRAIKEWNMESKMHK